MKASPVSMMVTNRRNNTDEGTYALNKRKLNAR